MRSTLRTIQMSVLAFAAGSCLMLALGFFADDTAAGPHVQEMRGIWDGFSMNLVDPPEPVRTEITSQQDRRFSGFVQPPDPVQPVTLIEGTVSASGNINYQGQGPHVHTVGKARVLDLGGGAAILDASETRHSNGETFIIPCVLELRSFNNPPEPITPNHEGRYVGTLGGEGGLTGQIDMRLGHPPEPVRPTSFDGMIEVVIGGETHSFLLRGTTNGNGRIVAIAATTEGHMVVDAILADPPDPSMPATLNGSFTLELHDGTELNGTFATEQVRAIPT